MAKTNKVVKLLKLTFRNISTWAKGVTIPGFDGVPLYDVGVFYKNGIANGAIGVRAGAISFSFFLALFPTIIFVFTLIPFIPIPNFQLELIGLIQQVLPSNTFQAIENTIVDITINKRGSLLSFGFIAALIFSTNGVSAMIAAFNASANAFENRSFLSMRAIAVVLVFILVLLTSVATGLIIFGRTILRALVTEGLIHNSFSHILFVSGQWIVLFVLILLMISFLYYYAPSKRDKFTFFSPGSIVATLLVILSTLAFSYYLTRFGRYNKLYGSIGTLIALLIWLNLNSFVLLVGFELNVSIRNARFRKDKHLKLSQNSQEYEKYYPKTEDLLKNN